MRKNFFNSRKYTKPLSSPISSTLKKGGNWTISLISPKSKRFSQISFEGFRPKGSNLIEKFFNLFKEFVTFIIKYFSRKLKYVARFLSSLPLKFVNLTMRMKFWLVRKLIWSRGKLGRSIATGIVMSVAFFIFLFGEVFNSSKYVNSQEIDPDYLSNVTDIIPQRNTALTTIPESRKQSEAFTYVVESGDTLSSIGNRFKISTDALKYVNNLSDLSVLRVGQELTIPPVSGLVHTVKRGESLSSIARKYDVPAQAIADFNYILDTSSLTVDAELVIPGAKVPQVVVAPVTPSFTPGTTVTAPTGGDWCIWPTSSRIITQYFSWYHNGVDIGTSSNPWPPLIACAQGTVIRAGWDPFGLGLHVRIDHGNGYETVYGHMNNLNVSYGQRVSQGQVLGQMGSTGRSTGPHVHFIVKYNGVAQNPLNYIK